MFKKEHIKNLKNIVFKPKLLKTLFYNPLYPSFNVVSDYEYNPLTFGNVYTRIWVVD